MKPLMPFSDLFPSWWAMTFLTSVKILWKSSPLQSPRDSLISFQPISGLSRLVFPVLLVSARLVVTRSIPRPI
jgi:hypothetical protein